MSVSWDLSDFFSLMMRLGTQLWGGGPRRFATHSIPRVHAVTALPHVDLDLLAEAVSVGLLHVVPSLLSFPHGPLWKEGTMHITHVRE